jgi:hypothetical protein
MAGFADEIATAIRRVNAIAEAGQNAVISLWLRPGGTATALQRRLPSPPDERYVKYSSDY